MLFLFCFCSSEQYVVNIYCLSRLCQNLEEIVLNHSFRDNRMGSQTV